MIPGVKLAESKSGFLFAMNNQTLLPREVRLKLSVSQHNILKWLR